MTGAAAAPAAERVPCVWVVASHRSLSNEHGHPQEYTLIDEGGTRALLNLGLQPVSYPRVPVGRLALLLDEVQGVLMGGSATNVHPRHYGEEPAHEGLAYDEERDIVALALVPLAIERRVPLIGFCRGAQEFNVAMGGSLHQDLRSRGGTLVHWEDPHEPLKSQYAERHDVSVVPHGALAQLTQCPRFPVSSLHSQGVKRLAPGMVAEAHADDGLIEAFRWHEDDRFAWGFQFHPEWGHDDHPHYRRIMGAFVDACWSRLREGARPHL